MGTKSKLGLGIFLFAVGAWAGDLALLQPLEGNYTVKEVDGRPVPSPLTVRVLASENAVGYILSQGGGTLVAENRFTKIFEKGGSVEQESILPNEEEIHIKYTKNGADLRISSSHCTETTCTFKEIKASAP